MKVSIFLFFWHLSSTVRTEDEFSFTALNGIQNVKQEQRISTHAKTFKHLLQESEVFIDKTLLIKAIMSNFELSVTFTRPAKWGKSINLHMLKDFLEMPITCEGNPMNIINTTQYRLFKHGEVTFASHDTKKLRKPLLISQDKEFFDKYFGKFPVIYFSLKNLKWMGYDRTIAKLGQIISEVFIEHHYLMILLQDKAVECEESMNNIDENRRVLSEIKYFKKILYCAFPSEVEVVQSLSILSRFLHDFFHRKVIILVDDYDEPIMNMLEKHTYSEDERKFLTFFQLFLDLTFKSNRYLEKAVLTGVLPIASISYNMQCSLNGRLIELYGFSPEDVYLLLDEYKYTVKETRKLINWYGGYQTIVNELHESFNPWSVVNFLNYNRFDYFWIQSDESCKCILPLIYYSSLVRDVVERLIKKQPVRIEFVDKKGLTENEILALVETILVKDVKHINVTTTDMIFQYMLAKGCVTVVPKSFRQNTYEIKLPNHETIGEYTKHLLSFYTETTKIENITLEFSALYLYEFMKTDKKTSEKLRDSLSKLFLNLRPLKDLFKNSSYSENETKDLETDLIHAAANTVIMKLTINQHFDTDIVTMFYDGVLNSSHHAALQMHELQRGTIITVNYGNISVDQVLKRALRYEVHSENPIKSTKYIAINVLLDRSVQIFARTLKNKMKNVTVSN